MVGWFLWLSDFWWYLSNHWSDSFHIWCLGSVWQSAHFNRFWSWLDDFYGWVIFHDISTTIGPIHVIFDIWVQYDILHSWLTFGHGSVCHRMLKFMLKFFLGPYMFRMLTGVMLTGVPMLRMLIHFIFHIWVQYDNLHIWIGFGHGWMIFTVEWFLMISQQPLVRFISYLVFGFIMTFCTVD